MDAKMSLNRVFIFDQLTVYFKHTDYFGFVHPYNYFEWTSYVREAFFQSTVANFEEVISRSIKMMTSKIVCSVLADARFGDKIEARLTIAKRKKVSFDMITRFYNATRQVVSAETVHTVVFVDSVAGDFAMIPPEMMNVIVYYEDPAAGMKTEKIPEIGNLQYAHITAKKRA